MARKSRQGVLKRQRERKKAEKAELKRDARYQRNHAERGESSPVATQDDLAAYGLGPDTEPEES